MPESKVVHLSKCSKCLHLKDLHSNYGYVPDAL